MKESIITEKKPNAWRAFPAPAAGVIKLTTADKGKNLAGVSPPSNPPPGGGGPGGAGSSPDF